MRSLGRHADWLVEGTVFLIAGLLSLLFIAVFGLLHVFLYSVYPAILIAAGIVLVSLYFVKRK